VKALGIDIGGSGVKGAVVNLKKGVFATDRLRIETPQPATPEAVSEVVAQIVDHFDWQGPVGVTFPGVVTTGTIQTAANLAPGWIGLDGHRVFSAATGCDCTVLNDADAAGLAEVAYGGDASDEGLVILLTLGTGIGSAVIHHGELVPNSELGHLPLNGGSAEKYAASSVREALELSYEDWAGRVSEYMQLVETLLWPDQFLVGGGISKHADEWLPMVKCRTPIAPAHLLNKAGIIGAALQASRIGAAADDGKGHKSKHKHKHKS
jgi:polyphosphate glucokinase